MMRTLYIIGVLFVLSFLSSPPSQAQSPDAAAAGRLYAWFKRAARFDYDYPREKVYVQLDNSSYLEGDTIRYKAYVVRASSLLPTTLSRVLYVDLLNADGQLVDQQVQHIDSLGQCDGAFTPGGNLFAGYYEVRAYTRAMTNWDAAACWSRIIPVFTSANPNHKEERTVETSVEQLTLPEPEPHRRVTFASPRPYVLGDNDERLLTFYPEGGWRVKGLAQRVAYRLTDGRGRATTDTLTLYAADGTVAGSVTPEFEGMGTLDLPADFTTGYVRLSGVGIGRQALQRDYALPLPTAPLALTAQVDGEGLHLVLQSNDSLARSGALLGVALTHREQVCYFDTLTASTEAIELLIPSSALRLGVCRAVIYDTTGRTLASRQVWADVPEEHDRRVKVSVAQNERSYAPFSPAVLQVQLHDAAGAPVQTTVSVAVRDRAGNITDTHDGGLRADLLLSSEIRGYIHRPDLYFAKNDAAHRRMLDLLLLVQGWQAETWDVMCGRDSFALSQPIEDHLILRGRILRDNRKKAPWAGQTLDFKAYSLNGGAIEGTTRTDDRGRFTFASKVNFEGTFIGQFSTRDENGKRRWTRLMLDRWFAPQPGALFGSALELHQPLPADSLTLAEEGRLPETFAWTDTIPRILPKLLQSATATGKTRYRGFTGNRYTYGGGEKRGMKYGTKFFNLEQEVEHAKDLGYGIMGLNELFAFMNGDFNLRGLRDSGWDVLDRGADQGSPNLTASAGMTAVGEDVPPSLGTTPDLPSDDARIQGERNGDLTYRNRPVTVLLNNQPFGELVERAPELYGDMKAEEFKSAYLVESNLATDAVSGKEKRVSATQYKLYLYEIPDFYRYRGKRGIEKRRIRGFSPKTSFYAPNYRSFDLPSDHDLRRTLHWEPSLRTDNKGCATLIFFTNARPDQWLDLSIRGITRDGLLVDFDR